MTGRLRSLDVFRGATVALMILVNNPGSWSHLYPPLAHAGWHGCTPTDLVFPFFLFAVGNALALVLPGLRAGPPALFWERVARRTLLIFAIGLFLNAAPFVRWDGDGALVLKSWETLRFMGVLQRIALCFGAAAAVVWLFDRQGVLITAAALLGGYALACAALGDPADPYGLIGWFGTAIDRSLLGAAHLYRGEGLPFDPEGLASTPPAIAQVLLGWWVGDLIRREKAGAALVVRLFMIGASLLVAGYLWQLELPFNKKIWTSSYVLHTTGLATLALAALFQLLEVAPQPGRAPGWVRVLEAFGRNPLFVFVLSGFVPRLLALFRWADGVNADGTVHWITPLPWVYQTVFTQLGSDPRLGSFLFAAANLTVYGLLAVWLDRRKVYIRV
jgi:predicted acyltransferase